MQIFLILFKPCIFYTIYLIEDIFCSCARTILLWKYDLIGKLANSPQWSRKRVWSHEAYEDEWNMSLVVKLMKKWKYEKK